MNEERKETDIQEVVNHFFYSKGYTIETIKQNKNIKIIYSRFVKPAKELIKLSGSVNEAKKAITTVSDWAKSRGLDYSIETVFKKWFELDKLKPKEIIKKPFYDNQKMVWSNMKNKWFVITEEGEWLEFAGDFKKDVEWK